MFHSKSVHQICFLDFTLFPEHPEFYGNYMFQNIKNQQIYSDKLKLSVVDLTKIPMATDEDKLYRIDAWANLFKATTWEELKMITKNNEYLEDAAETAWKLSEEEAIRLQCEAREDFYRQQRFVEHRISFLTEENAAVKQEINTVKQENDAVKQEINIVKQENDAVKQEINNVKQENHTVKEENAQLRAELERLQSLLKKQTES